MYVTVPFLLVSLALTCLIPDLKLYNSSPLQMTHDQSSAVFSFFLILTCKRKTKLDIVYRVKRLKQGQWRET